MSTMCEIRLSLINTREQGDSGYSEAKQFTESRCPIGSKALVDEDDGQKEGSFDRVIGLVYCENEKLLLNEHLLNVGHAQVFVDFCGVSEYSAEIRLLTRTTRYNHLTVVYSGKYKG